MLRPPILILEDSDEDYEVIADAFAKKNLTRTLKRFTDGDQCLDYLAQYPPGAPPPALLVLDLNTPGTDGREVLAEVKADPALRVTPVIVVTSSSNPKDIEFCYTKGANSYQVKPMDIAEFDHKLSAMIGYWLETAVLPASIDQRAGGPDRP